MKVGEEPVRFSHFFWVNSWGDGQPRLALKRFACQWSTTWTQVFSASEMKSVTTVAAYGWARRRSFCRN